MDPRSRSRPSAATFTSSRASVGSSSRSRPLRGRAARGDVRLASRSPRQPADRTSSSCSPAGTETAARCTSSACTTRPSTITSPRRRGRAAVRTGQGSNGAGFERFAWRARATGPGLEWRGRRAARGTSVDGSWPSPVTRRHPARRRRSSTGAAAPGPNRRSRPRLCRRRARWVCGDTAAAGETGRSRCQSRWSPRRRHRRRVCPWARPSIF